MLFLIASDSAVFRQYFGVAPYFDCRRFCRKLRHENFARVKHFGVVRARFAAPCEPDDLNAFGQWK